MTDTILHGLLTSEGDQSFLITDEGSRILASDLIWDGYLKHWVGKKVFARHLQQRDYQNNQPIIIMWPDEPLPTEPFVDLYYNERLVKYPASTFGHNAINVNGSIYNFSHLINENEVMSPEEYFFRPALGEFGPSPRTGKFEIFADGTAYFDKFGRNFMRTIHVVRIFGIDTERLTDIYNRELDIIHNAEVNPKNPEKYQDFNFFNRSCSTIIRDGLRTYGFKKINGFLPRDMFVSATYELLQAARQSAIQVRRFSMPQLNVLEAEPSALTPLYNLRNIWRARNFPPETTSK